MIQMLQFPAFRQYLGKVKKVFISILAILYITITSGVMVNIHYCMGKMTSVEYGNEKQKNCSSCGMEQKDGCCHTEHKFIKSGDQHLFVKNIADLSAGYVVAVSETPAYPINDFYTSRVLLYSPSHSPPDNRQNNLRLYNCVFRI
jgi:hypothetical protein